MITALVSNGDLGGMDTYSLASQSFTPLVLTSFAQRLMTIQYEISGLREILDLARPRKQQIENTGASRLEKMIFAS